ncbi:hypothetical protein B0H34DRAFT_676707 [Crassisporium funariophilum]|nr:hypothetical protein B0H34DRAFT_676707 [Crassisporium funariophilum]
MNRQSADDTTTVMLGHFDLSHWKFCLQTAAMSQIKREKTVVLRQSLALLKPWTLLGKSTDNLVVQRVSAEAAQYVDAIKLGVSAAYSGFTATEEVVFLAESLPSNDPADLQRYLECPSTDSPATALNTLNTLPQDLQEVIEVLVRFADNTSDFAVWWDWVKIESDPQISNQPMEFRLDFLRDKNVINRSRELRSQYTDYVQMVGETEDTDPHFFQRPQSKKK